jgi:hypothetical protein
MGVGRGASDAPKGHNKTAQGNALGRSRNHNKKALKGNAVKDFSWEIGLPTTAEI